MSSSARRRLLDDARAMGFVVLGADGRSHIKVKHTVTGVLVSLPNSVPDHRVLLARYRAGLRRAAGLSKQGQPAIEGTRRERKPRRVDPAEARAARDRAAILAGKQRRAAYARRLEELRSIDDLMRATWS